VSATRAPEAFRELPLVSLAGLDAGGAERAETVAALSRAARDVGFVYVTDHGVPAAGIHELERAAREFFALPEAAKLAYYIGNSAHHRGYVPPGEEVFYGQSRDTKEAFDLSRELPEADYGAASRFLGPNQWPREVAGFQRAVTSYYDSAFALGRKLLGAFAEALGLSPTHFDAVLVRPPSQLRLIHYPPAADAENTMGIGAHTDYECLTILHATAPGLQVMNGAGEWVEAPPAPGAFVINIGDLLEIFSNGHFVSTSHRVLPVRVERYSFPLFFCVDYHTRVAPLPELSRDGARYAEVVAGEHLLAQTMQSFRYLKLLQEQGAAALPEGARALSSFGRDRRPAGG